MWEALVQVCEHIQLAVGLLITLALAVPFFVFVHRWLNAFADVFMPAKDDRPKFH